MKFAMLTIIALIVTGCAAKVISTSERSVMIQARIQDAAEAQELATKECAKYNRVARFTIKPHINQYAYDCIDK